MRPNQYKQFIKATLQHNPKQAVIVLGQVGGGKSETTFQAVDELGYEFRDIRLSLLESVDLRGMPSIDQKNKTTEWLRPVFLPPPDYDKDLVLFFDEFTCADKEVMNACLQLVLDRQIGEYKLPEKTRIICAGNRVEDGAYVTQLSSAMSNRFITIVFNPDFDDWKLWAYEHKINSLIIGYHNFTKGQHLSNFSLDSEDIAFASPRSWFFVHRVLNMGLENGTLFEAVKGCIGEAVGTEFYGYMKIYRDLPSAKEILNGSDIIPKETNIMYALISALINEVMENKEKVNRLIEYSLKLQKEFSVVLVKDLMKTELRDEVIKCPAFNQWVTDNKEIIIK